MFALLQIQMKADNGSALGLEEYVQQILSSPYLGVLELILFMRMAASECENVPEMYYQIWQGADALPAVLWYAPEASQASADTGTSPLPAVSLKLITLPLSKKLIWLPMARADQHDTGSADRFKQQLLALDAHNVAEARAKAKLAPSKQPQQSKPEPKSAFKRKLRSYRQAQPAHPAESSASVLVRKRPGPSPDSDSPTGKARHM